MLILLILLKYEEASLLKSEEASLLKYKTALLLICEEALLLKYEEALLLNCKNCIRLMFEKLCCYIAHRQNGIQNTHLWT